MLFRFLPAMLLVAVACNQFRLTITADLTPWKGGGFGMFSTIDNWSKRSFLITGTTIDGERVSLDTAAKHRTKGDRAVWDRLRSFPNRGALLIAGRQLFHEYNRNHPDEPLKELMIITLRQHFLFSAGQLSWVPLGEKLTLTAEGGR